MFDITPFLQPGDPWLATEDADLVERCCRGDAGAWEEFVRAHGPAIRAAARHAFLRMRHPATDHDVENIAQDVFTALCEDYRRRLRGFQGRCSLAGWLRAVATNHALNHVRAERIRRARSLESDPLLVPEACVRLPDGARAGR